MKKKLLIASATLATVAALTLLFWKPGGSPPRVAALIAINDVYIIQNGSGTQAGTSCANAKPYTWFNNAANWTSGTPTGALIGPGTVVHLCGTTTAVANTNLMDAKGSGTSANPITILYEPGAITQAPYFPYATESSGTVAGLITINTKNYIVIDGGGTGIIRTTANGTSLANKQNSTAISIKSCTGCIVRDITVGPIYVHVPGVNDTSGFNTDGIVIFDSPSVVIGPNVTAKSASFPIYSFYNSPGTWTHEIKNSVISDYNEGIRCPVNANGAVGLSIHDNSFQATGNWDVNSTFHNNGIHCYAVASPKVLQHPLVFNNTFTGNLGTTTTAMIYMESTGGGLITDGWYFNNVLYSSNTADRWSYGLLEVNGPSPVIVNNTIIGSSTQGSTINACIGVGSGSTNTIIRNNTCQTFNYNQAYFTGVPTWTAVSNNNYYNYANFGVQVNVGGFSLATWQSTTGGDATPPSTLTNPNVAFSAPWKPIAGSPLIGAGANLSAMCSQVINGISAPALCSDINGVARGSSWDVGAAQASGSAGAPAISLSPSPVAFGNVNVGSTSSAITVTVSNTGTATETLATPHYTISNPEFARTGGTCLDGGIINAGSNCTESYTCAPSGTGIRTATLNILGTVNATATMTCTGTQAAIAFSPSPLAFGNQLINTTSTVRTVTVTNTGTSNLILATPYYTLTGTNSSNFANTGAGSCANAATIIPGGNCTITATFTPSATGARSATLTVNGTVSASLSLTGTGTQPALTLSPSPVAFGSVNVSSTSAPVTVTVSNTGTGDEVLATPHFSITGTNAADYARTGGTCPDGGIVTAGSNCTEVYTCRPSATGARVATLTILGSVNATASMTCNGTSVPVPVVQLGPRTVNFGSVATGTSSAPTTFTLQNTGTATLTITSILSSDAVRYPISANVCGATLAAGASCTFADTFTPNTAATITATITVTTNAASSPDTISLTGVGFTPNPQPEPAPAPVIFIGGALPPQPVIAGVAAIDPCNVNSFCTYIMTCSQCSSSTQVYIDNAQVSQTYSGGTMKFKSKLTPGSHNYLAVNVN